jgi:hypothetical protein
VLSNPLTPLIFGAKLSKSDYIFLLTLWRSAVVLPHEGLSIS